MTFSNILWDVVKSLKTSMWQEEGLYLQEEEEEEEEEGLAGKTHAACSRGEHFEHSVRIPINNIYF